MRVLDPDKGIFSISIVSEMLGVTQKQLRLYEEKGIIKPARTVGNHRLYSQRNIEMLIYIHYLVSVRKVTAYGLKVIVELLDLLPGRERERVIKSAEAYLDQHAHNPETPVPSPDAYQPAARRRKRNAAPPAAPETGSRDG